VQSSSEVEAGVEEPNEVTAFSENGHNIPDVHIDSEIRNEAAEVCGVSDNFGSDHVRQYAAKWILKTRECRALTRSAMQGIIEDVTDLLDFACLSVKAKVYKKLSSMGINSSDLTQLDEIFDNCGKKIFDGVVTFHQQLQFYRQNFRFVVSVLSLFKSIGVIYLLSLGKCNSIPVDWQFKETLW